MIIFKAEIQPRFLASRPLHEEGYQQVQIAGAEGHWKAPPFSFGTVVNQRLFRSFQGIDLVVPQNGILDGLKNHPMEFDDSILRQILECGIIKSKERNKVIFTGGLEGKQPLY